MGRVVLERGLGCVLALLFAACTVSASNVNEKEINLPERDLENAEVPADDPGTTTRTQEQDKGGSSGSGGSNATDSGAPSDASPPASAGKWYQANEEECVAFCVAKGLTNAPSPEGARCTSGEAIFQSAIDQKIVYDGCFPDCKAHPKPNARSYKDECYGDGQKQDGDATDKTRGCFCK